jgi:hypothetical protein
MSLGVTGMTGEQKKKRYSSTEEMAPQAEVQKAEGTKECRH